MPVSQYVNDSTYTYTQDANSNLIKLYIMALHKLCLFRDSLFTELIKVVEFLITKNYPARGEYTPDL